MLLQAVLRAPRTSVDRGIAILVIAVTFSLAGAPNAQSVLTGVVKVISSSAANHSCAITTIGGLKCWGANNSGQLGDGTLVSRESAIDVPGFATGVADVALGREHTCVLTTSGAMRCWGNNGSGQLGTGNNAASLAPVTPSGMGSGVVAIAAGSNHSCAATGGSNMKCWGSNSNGQLGTGDTTTINAPPGSVINSSGGGLGGTITSISAGDAHTCALVNTGIKCWGRGDNGRLGYTASNPQHQSLPVNVFGLTNGVAMVRAGFDYTCAVLISGGAKCWGDNQLGHLGNGNTQQQNLPDDVRVSAGTPLTGVASIASGEIAGCATLTNGAVKCWGRNSNGQVGNGTTNNQLYAVDVVELGSSSSALTNANSIAAGSSHSCAVTAVGGVKCWGSNVNKQLGDGTTTDRNVPVSVGLKNPIAAGLSIWISTSCITISDGKARCRGDNTYGQLGDGTATSRETYADVVGLNAPVKSTVTGPGHTCALTTSGAVKCWGYNGHGALGNGSTVNSNLPVDVVALKGPADKLVLGGAKNPAEGVFTCAIFSPGPSGTAQCWGSNEHGQLGNGIGGSGLFETRPVDVKVSQLGEPLTGIVDLALGVGHSCALLSSGTVMCWGDNSKGQLTTITGYFPAVPTPQNVRTLGVVGNPWSPVGTLTNATSISAGDDHTCARIVDGTVRCWGEDAYNQNGFSFGNNAAGSPEYAYLAVESTNVSPSGAIQYNMLQGAIGVATAGNFSCALVSGGAVKCWGLFPTENNWYWDQIRTFIAGGATAMSAHQSFDGQYLWPLVCVTNTANVTECIRHDRAVVSAPTSTSPIVTPSAGANGSISPATPQRTAVGSAMVFSVTASPNYIASIDGATTCHGTLSGSAPSYLYSIPAVTQSCALNISFSLPTFAITTAANPAAGGTVTCLPNPVSSGGSTTCSAQASVGYVFSSFSGACNGASCTLNNVASPANVTANFNVATYTVTPSAGANGSISPSTTQTVTHGQTIAFTISPSNGFVPTIATGAGQCGGTLNGTTYTTNPITANCAVSASFMLPVSCTAGSWSSSGSAPCTLASLGNYVPGPGATSQTACSIGTYQNLEGQSSCKAADPGYFVSQTGASAQIACSAGSYQPVSSSASCALASIGYYVPAIAATEQIQCPQGATTTALGATECEFLRVLNIDNSGPNTFYDAATDGVLLMRYLLGLRGSALVDGARGTGPALRDATSVAAHLATYIPPTQVPSVFDVDGDGIVSPLTDGLMILRRLLNSNSIDAMSPAERSAITVGAKQGTLSDLEVLRRIETLKSPPLQ